MTWDWNGRTSSLSGSTLNHFATVGEIAQAVKELARVLRPSGRLLLTLDNPLNPLVALRNGPLLRLFRHSGIVPYQVGATLGPGRWPASFALAVLWTDRTLEIRMDPEKSYAIQRFWVAPKDWMLILDQPEE